MKRKRRGYNRDETKYKEIHRIERIKGAMVLRKIKETKEQWLDEECTEIEIFYSRHNVLNAHKNIKGVAGLWKKWEQE